MSHRVSGVLCRVGRDRADFPDVKDCQIIMSGGVVRGVWQTV